MNYEVEVKRLVAQFKRLKTYPDKEANNRFRREGFEKCSEKQKLSILYKYLGDRRPQMSDLERRTTWADAVAAVTEGIYTPVRVSKKAENPGALAQTGDLFE